MLPACRCDQPVERVIGVLRARLYSAVAEVDSLLGVVPDVGDVPGWVVGVMEVLRTARWVGRIRTIVREGRAARGEQLDRTKRLRVVLVLCPHTVAKLDQRALALGVVINVGDEKRDAGGAA